METSDSDYFESADEDFHSSDENDQRKTKIKSSSHIKSETSHKLHSLHLHENEQSTRCIPEANKITIQEETRLADLINENLKVELDNNTYKENNVRNVITQIDNVEANVNKEDVKLSTECKQKTLIMCDSDMKKEVKDSTTNIEDETACKMEHLNKKLPHKDVGNNETMESNNEFENMWSAEDWVVDYPKDKEKVVDSVGKNTTKIKDTSQTTSDVIEENMWENDEWEPIDEEEINCVKSNSGKETTSAVNDNVDSHAWAKWGNWGVSSVLSTASQSVSTLTSSVSQGISTVLETSMGVPDPEELARLNHTEEKQKSDQSKNDLDEEYKNKNLLGFGFGNLGNLVSGVSKLVESTSTKVISGGLDTLETIGKKTMEVLQEGDPGLKKKRAFLKLNVERPVLSQVLREAKERVEQESETVEKPVIRKVNYETLFDDHQGLVHLEALEMLSKQCEIKLQTLIDSSTGETLSEIQETISQVKELCELPDEDEHEPMSSDEIRDRLKSVVDDIGIRITYDKLISIWEDTELWLNNLEPSDSDEMELQ